MATGKATSPAAYKDRKSAAMGRDFSTSRVFWGWDKRKAQVVPAIHQEPAVSVTEYPPQQRNLFALELPASTSRHASILDPAGRSLNIGLTFIKPAGEGRTPSNREGIMTKLTGKNQWWREGTLPVEAMSLHELQLAALCNEIYRAPYEKRLEETARVLAEEAYQDPEFDVAHDGVTREEVCLWLADLARDLIEEELSTRGAPPDSLGQLLRQV